MPRRAKGPHLLYRERERRWYIRDGAVERSTGCGEDDRRGAEAALQAYLAAKYTPSFGRGDPARVLISDVIVLYSQERQPSPKSPEAYAVSPLIDFWHGMTVSEITPQSCRAYARWRMEQPVRSFKDQSKARRVSRAAPRRELEVLRAALGHAHHERKLLYPVPVTLPDKPLARDRWLTRGEVARLIQAARQADNLHVARFVVVGFYTGTRHRAILGLRWTPSLSTGWVDLDRRIIYRRGSREDQTKKRRTPVPISDRLLAHLKRWKAKSATHVIEWRGEPIGSIRVAWDKVREKAGLGPEVTPHILRHTFASHAMMAGMPIGQVAAALGTRESIVQDTYGHLSPDSLRGVVNSVSRRKG